MKLRTFAVSFVTVLTTVLITPASSALADDSCQNGKLCVWSQILFTGAKQVENAASVECVGITVPGGAESARNLSGAVILFFSGGMCLADGVLTAELVANSEDPEIDPSGSFFSYWP